MDSSSIEPLNTLHLPEIQFSNTQEDWGFLSKPQEQDTIDKEFHIPSLSSSPPSPTSQTTENDIIPTTGLKRALSLSNKASNVDTIRTEIINISTSNPSHLFWVPASQHPEIAPAEFEKYVQAHGVIVRKKSTKRQSILSMYFTANDTQKPIENIENTVENEEDKTKKRQLRRSLSLQLPPNGDYARNVPDLLVFDRNSSPFDESRALVPKGDRPLLRRGARTNFKRNSSVSPYRNGSVNRKSESDCIEEEKEHLAAIPRSTSAEGITLSDISESDSSPLSPVVETKEVRDLCISTRDPENQVPPIVMTRSVSTSTASSSQSRKSNWSWAFWSDEKSAKKLPKETEESADSSKRFTLSSLFTRKSKSNQNYTSSIEKITSHLNKQNAPKDFQLNPMLLTRLPLHVERAIYKLSHFKLANPRRPLHEQVLISNHMFWYLSIVANHPPQEIKKPPRKRLVKKKNRMPANTNFLASKNESTGFVVPDNYLNPTKHKKQISSDSSSSEDDDDDDDDDEEENSDEDVDDLPLALYKLK